MNSVNQHILAPSSDTILESLFTFSYGESFSTFCNKNKRKSESMKGQGEKVIVLLQSTGLLLVEVKDS